jgi:hypothetical protein
MLGKFFFKSFILFPCLVASYAYAAQQPETNKVWTDGTFFEGELINGKQDGEGKIVWPDGTQFIGTFKNGLREGAGKLILPDNSIYVAIFENDVVVPGTAGLEGPKTPVPVSATYLSEMSGQFESEIRTRVDSWSKAWSTQNTSVYFAHYSTDFSPTDGSTIADWKQNRSSKVSRPRSIEIAVDDFDFEKLGARELTVTFGQSYTSNLYSDVTRKQLDFRLEDGVWRILREQILD